MLCRMQHTVWLVSLPRGCSAHSCSCGHQHPRVAPQPSEILSPSLWGPLTSSPTSSAMPTPEGSQQFPAGFQLQRAMAWPCSADGFLGVPLLHPPPTAPLDSCRGVCGVCGM